MREIDAERLVYESVKAGVGGGSVNLMLTPLELIERFAALTPPPRPHRHRYYGVLAPNAPAMLGSYRAGRLLNLRKRPFVCPEPEWLLRVDAVFEQSATATGFSQSGKQ